MEREEYARMRQAEDFHWWYRGLRALVDDAWRRHAPEGASCWLDAGCGTGAALEAFGGNGTAYGVDASQDALALCRDRGLTRVAQASVCALPFPPETFDAVLSLDVLYHRDVPDKAAALRAMARVLKPGGLLLVNVPAYNWLRSRHDAAIHTGQRFTRPQLQHLLENNGFEVRRITYWNTLLFPPALVVRLLRQHSTAETSDLEGAREGALNRVLGAVLAVERALLRIAPLPFGLSVFATATRR
jgi:SAM-dependent methyltransferase